MVCSPDPNTRTGQGPSYEGQGKLGKKLQAMRPKPENSEDCFDTAFLLFYKSYAPAFRNGKAKWFPISDVLAYFLMLAHIGLYTPFLNNCYCATHKIKAS